MFTAEISLTNPEASGLRTARQKNHIMLNRCSESLNLPTSNGYLISNIKIGQLSRPTPIPSKYITLGAFPMGGVAETRKATSIEVAFRTFLRASFIDGRNKEGFKNLV